MEEGLNLTECHQRWIISNRRGLVTNHMCDREANIILTFSKQFGLAAHFIHPCSSTFLCWTRVGIQVKVSLGLSIFSHLKEAYIFVPHRDHSVSCYNVHTIEPVGELEKPIQNIWQGKIGSQFLIADRVLGFLQAFCPVRDIPQFDFFGEPLLRRKVLHIL